MLDQFWRRVIGKNRLERLTADVLRDRAEKRVRVAPMRGVAQRLYTGAAHSRLTTGFGGSAASANAELESGLRLLRQRSRQLIRDSAYAKRAKQVVVNNVIGTGIGLQAEVRGTRDELREPVNTAIEKAWDRWSDAAFCHIGGKLNFSDLERQAMGQCFEAGEVLIRFHPFPVGGADVPLTLELIEPERLADGLSVPGPEFARNKVVMGVEVDAYYRPLAYWIKKLHTGEHRFGVGDVDTIERVPAEQIVHLYVCDRWPQNRGEPWMHAVVRKLADIDGYTEAEIVAARAASMYFATIETPEDTASLAEVQADGSYQMGIEPGIVEKLNPGEKLNFTNPNRPNAALDPFLRYMLREMAAGVGTSYESLSRDYSQSNYSSSRLALLEDRDNWRALQQWFIRSFRQPLHRVWLKQAMLARAIPNVQLAEYAADAPKFEAVSFKPRGWSWIDPTSEVEAYSEAVKAGYTTVTQVIAETGGGRDFEDVLKERVRELEAMQAASLTFTTSPESYEKPEPAPTPAPAPPAEEPEPEDEDDEEEDEEETEVATADRLVALVRDVVVAQSETAHRFADAFRQFKPTNLIQVPERSVTINPTITVPERSVHVDNHIGVPPAHVLVEATTVQVEPTPIVVMPAEVRVDVAAAQGPTVNVAAPEVTVHPPTVNVAAPEVTVRNDLPGEEISEHEAIRDAKGRIKSVRITKHRKG